MQTYIVRINDPSVREKLKQRFESVGKPRSIHKTIIVETDKSKEEIENIDGVTRVQEDIEIEFGEYQDHEVNNWALPRICGDFLDPSSYDEGHGKYVYNRTGENVDVYIADTGIMESHKDFKDENGNSRVKKIYPENFHPSHKKGNYYGTSHGTSVASCAGGNECGIAKKCNLFNVWVLKSGSSVIKGIDRVLEHHLNKDNNNPSILNMSFGYKNSDTHLYDETKDLVENGVICVACAHNYNEEKSTAPAIHKHVLSVGSVDWSNKITPHSNYGETVQFLAPGEHVKVAMTNNGFELKASGTSFASPYTAGILALIVQDSIIKNEEDVNKAINILYSYANEHLIKLYGENRDNKSKGTSDKFSFSLVENHPINNKPPNNNGYYVLGYKYSATPIFKDVSDRDEEFKRKTFYGFDAVEKVKDYIGDPSKVEILQGHATYYTPGGGTHTIYGSDAEQTLRKVYADKLNVENGEAEKDKDFKVVTEIEGKGTVTPNDTVVNEMERVSFEVEPKDGYKLREVQGEGTMSDKTFTTEPIEEDTKLVFVFEPIKYKVTVEVEGEGTVEPMEVEVSHGEKAEFNYEPKEGYKLKEVKNG